MTAFDSSRIRAMYLLPAAGFGGAERQGVLHIRHLAAHGVDVVPVVGPGDLVRRALVAEGVGDPVFLPRMPEDVSGSIGSWPGFARDWIVTQRELLPLARERRVDLVFASRSVGWIAASEIARRLALPLVWRGGSRITRRAERVALRLLAPAASPDLFLANCDAVAADLAPYVRAPIELLVNAIDGARFDPRSATPSVRSALGLAEGAPIVGLAARPAPGKGLELLAEVVERTMRALPSVRFVIAGDFPWRAHYERLFAERGLAERVTFLGHVDDMPGFYASCDVVVLTSEQASIEGSPNALLEAMCLGKAVVATRVGGVPELINDGEHGLLVEPGDAAGFAQRLTALLNDAIARKRLGQAARARVLARHDLHVVVGRLAGLLHDVRARHARARRSRLALAWRAPRIAAGAPTGEP